MSRIVKFSFGRLVRGELLTLEQLKRRGRPLVNGYFFSKVEGESIDHIPLHCAKTSVLCQLLCFLLSLVFIGCKL